MSALAPHLLNSRRAREAYETLVDPERPPSPVRPATASRSCPPGRGPRGDRHAAVCRTAIGLAPHVLRRSRNLGEVSSEGGDKNISRYEQTLMIPQFLDLEKLTASHRHGMLRLTLPLKESVKPRRVQIETQVEDQKQLTGVR
jgi:hypothetical protein